MAKLKPKKRGRPQNKKLSAYLKGKRGLERYARERQERLAAAQAAHDKAEEAKLGTSKWTRDLSWKSKPPPPEFIYMIINGKPIKCRLMHMHNMPVYLPDIDELP